MTHMSDICESSDHAREDKDEMGRHNNSVCPAVQDPAPQMQLKCQISIRQPLSIESVVTNIVRPPNSPKNSKLPVTLANGNPNSKNKSSTNNLQNIENDEVNTARGIQSLAKMTPDGSIVSQMDEGDSSTISSFPVHRPTWIAAIASRNYSREYRGLGQPVVPQTSSKLKATLKNIQKSGNKSKILMILALCVLCLPGNIVTIWLKYKQSNENPHR